MPDHQESRDTFNRELLSALRSLRPGVRQLSEEQEEVIAEYEHIKDQLAGPSFGPLPPQITGYERVDGTTRIYGTNLAAATVVKVGGTRVTRGGFRFCDGDEPYIEVQLPQGGTSGPVTVFTSGGLATRRLEGAAGREEVAAETAPRASWAEHGSGEATKEGETRRSPEGEGAE